MQSSEKLNCLYNRDSWFNGRNNFANRLRQHNVPLNVPPSKPKNHWQTFWIIWMEMVKRYEVLISGKFSLQRDYGPHMLSLVSSVFDCFASSVKTSLWPFTEESSAWSSLMIDWWSMISLLICSRALSFWNARSFCALRNTTTHSHNYSPFAANSVKNAT